MYALSKRIQRRRAEVAVTAIMRHARQNARIAVALRRDEGHDGGLLIHQALEQAEASRV